MLERALFSASMRARLKFMVSWGVVSRIFWWSTQITLHLPTLSLERTIVTRAMI